MEIQLLVSYISIIIATVVSLILIIGSLEWYPTLLKKGYPTLLRQMWPQMLLFGERLTHPNGFNSIKFTILGCSACHATPFVVSCHMVSKLYIQLPKILSKGTWYNAVWISKCVHKDQAPLYRQRYPKKKKNPIKTNLANHWVQGMKKYIWNYKRPILNLGTIQIYWLQIIRSAYKSFWLDIDRNKFQ